MEKMRLGKTELMVTRLGLGGIPIQRVSEEEAIAVINRCLELGINFIDTANGYTISEESIGKAIAKRAEKPILATKTTSRTQEGVAEHLKLSLKRLGVNYIDLYQLHNVSDADTLNQIFDPEGPLVTILEAKKADLIKHIGVSSHSIDIAKELVKSNRFETIMFPFNFITCEAADELLPMVREQDMGFIAMKPLAGGMLDNITIVFKYLFQFPDVVSIPGIEKPSEIEEIVQVLKASRLMTKPERREMQRLRKELGTQFCRRCDYCQPCTTGIPISTVMSARSGYKRLPAEKFFSGIFADAMAKAANCTQCDDCEERCPYHLPIREKLEELVYWYQEEERKYQEQLASKRV